MEQDAITGWLAFVARIFDVNLENRLNVILKTNVLQIN
jgi:hypothetical protein